MIENIKELKKDTLLHGPDGKIGNFYKKYVDGNETFIAIKYADNDYGMFNSDAVKIADNENT